MLQSPVSSLQSPLVAPREKDGGSAASEGWRGREGRLAAGWMGRTGSGSGRCRVPDGLDWTGQDRTVSKERKEKG